MFFDVGRSELCSPPQAPHKERLSSPCMNAGAFSRLKEDQEDSQIVANPSVGNTSFESALNAFITAHDAAGHSKVTLEDYKRTLGIFVSYMVEVHQYTSIQQVTEHDVLDWLAHLRN